ncbi:TetR/AcrR family transcriptional regulator [Ruania alba]|uniref:Regulatory protein, tetR family n=1 Tax=Ruania alba TaxID=648782 RepID=A0A1H5DEN0_9MICO|nr:TetR/AcrR family transcriptional regulator C-terminal domain-containing protein [Ruania alba]SED77301.1 regulatory protein, tetR family [Ruania alba]
MPQRRNRGPRGDLSLERVLAVGEELLAAGDPDRVSIRAVAAGLDVAPNALYTYVSSKGELHQRLADRGLARLELGVLEAAGAPGERLRTFALAARRALLNDPGVLRILATTPVRGPAAVALSEALLRTCSDGGLSLGQASRLTYALTVFLYGYLFVEIGDRERSQEPEPFDVDLASVPLTARMAQLPWDPAEEFERAVETLLAGYGLPAGARGQIRE